MNSRREFLQRLGASALAVPFIQTTPALAQADKQLRVAFVGLGSYARRVADAMQTCTMAKVVGGVTGTPSKVNDWTKQYGAPKENFYTYQNFDDIKNNPTIDAVYVTLPNAMHHEYVIRAAKAGKHVITEKPMSATVKEAEEMIAACKKAGVKLYVGYRMHFEPHTRELIRMREAGEFGKIMHVNAYMGFKIGDPTQWRLKKSLAGGGALYDVGVYCINAARYATGEEPIWISAEESKTDPIKFKEVDETITWQMGFPSGVIATCATTYNFNNFERLFVVGDKGFAELSPAFNYGPIVGKTHKGPLNQPVVTHQTLQMDGLADCILNNKPDPNMTGEEGLKDMKVIEAIYKSIAQGGKKVML
ncbi:MAG: Gfo/Idh/MocA family oxidoreductase [Spirosomataceae bacterium]